MSHLHLPDGVLPWWLVLLGWAGLVAALGLSLPSLRRGEQLARLPRLSFFAALMALAMSIEVLPLAYHFNLSVLAGIVLGPSVGFLAALVVVVMLALVGHGGMTVIGLNALLIGSEVVVGAGVYRWLDRRGLAPPHAAALATVVALAISTSAMVGLVALGGRGVLATGAHAAPSFKVFVALVYGAGAIGWLLEAILTAAIVRYLAAVRPRLLRPV